MSKFLFLSTVLAVVFSPQSRANDFDLYLGSYLSAEPAQARGLAINSNHQVVIGLNHSPTGTALIQYRHISDGAVAETDVLNSPMAQLISASDSDAWAAVGGFGLVVSDVAGALIDWQVDATELLGTPKRVGICDSSVVVLVDNSVVMYNRSQTFLGRFDVSATAVSDLTCGSGGHVFVTGYRQVSANLQQPFLASYTPSGMLLWENWGWSAAQAGAVNANADSRGIRVRFGQDGELYFSGSTDGGNNVFKFNPQDLSENANNTAFDAYNQTFNISGSRKFSYYARINPTNGDLLQGQFLLTRLSSGGGNSVVVDSMAVDTNGQLFAGGLAFASMQNRNDLTVNGVDVSPYAGGDPYILNTADDFSDRNVWHTFGANSAKGRITAVDTRGGVHVFLAAINQGSLITNRAIIDADDLTFTVNEDNQAVYLGIWGTVRADAIFSNGFEPTVF